MPQYLSNWSDTDTIYTILKIWGPPMCWGWKYWLSIVKSSNLRLLQQTLKILRMVFLSLSWVVNCIEMILINEEVTWSNVSIYLKNNCTIYCMQNPKFWSAFKFAKVAGLGMISSHGLLHPRQQCWIQLRWAAHGSGRRTRMHNIIFRACRFFFWPKQWAGGWDIQCPIQCPMPRSQCP